MTDTNKNLAAVEALTEIQRVVTRFYTGKIEPASVAIREISDLLTDELEATLTSTADEKGERCTCNSLKRQGTIGEETLAALHITNRCKVHPQPSAVSEEAVAQCSSTIGLRGYGNQKAYCGFNEGHEGRHSYDEPPAAQNSEALLALRDMVDGMIEISKSKLPHAKPGDKLFDVAQAEIETLSIVRTPIEAALAATKPVTDDAVVRCDLAFMAPSRDCVEDLLGFKCQVHYNGDRLGTFATSEGAS